MNVLQFEILAVGLIVPSLTALVAKKPKLFWPLLIIVNIIGNGPRLFKYYFWDEVLTGSIVLGAVMYLFIASIRNRDVHTKDKDQKQQHTIFNVWALYMIWILYMIFESILGCIINEDLRIIRWILFYSLLGVLSFILCNRGTEFPFPGKRQIIMVVLITANLFNMAHLAVGFIYERILGLQGSGRFLMQYLTEGWFLWSGAAAAVFPAFVVMPVAIMALEMRSVRMKALAWITIFILILIAFFYDARSVMVVIVGCFLVSLRKLKVKKAILMLFIFSCIFVVYVDNPAKHVVGYFGNLYRSTQMVWNPQERDVSRTLQFHAGLRRISDNMKTLFFGDGIYSHRYTILPYISQLYSEELPELHSIVVPEGHNDPSGGIFRTTGFTALLIDTGMVGMFLFIFVNYYILCRKLIRRKRAYSMLLLMIVSLSFMLLFYMNTTDIIMMYLLIMPGGLIEQLYRSNIGNTAPMEHWLQKGRKYA